MVLRMLGAVLAIGVMLAGCTFKGVPDPEVSARDREWMALVPQADVSPEYGRYLIDDPTGEPPGTIVVDQKAKFLYFVLPDRKAIRYGVAVGDEAYGWTGTAVVARKAEWPDWHPPAEMKARWPHVRFTKGGPNNPLGARALYLYRNGKDTHFRLHGTIEPYTIGTQVSSGCIRLMNQDIIDLYNRAEVGAKVIVQ